MDGAYAKKSPGQMAARATVKEFSSFLLSTF
jgi:hypothetical protein